MMHAFIFAPGVWEGSGTISFSMLEEVLEFNTTWLVLPKEEGNFYFNQEIEIKTFPEKMRNRFTLHPLSDSAFDIVLENQIVNKVVGSGLIDPMTIAWEFRRKDQDFEGFEIYELQPDGSYKMRAEFTSGDNMRTFVSGTIARKT